jgi:hypothetical protein
MAAYGLFIVLLFLVIFILQIVVCWRIASKAGYAGVASLLMLIPLVNFIVLLIFAFGEWPIEARLRAALATAGGAPYTGPPATI